MKARPAVGEYKDGAEMALDRSEQASLISDAPTLRPFVWDMGMVRKSSCVG